MICSCSKKKSSTSRRKTIQKSDLVKLRQAFRFTENEILELRSRSATFFSAISPTLTRFDSLLPPGANTINKDTFCDKMGVLGIDAGRFLSNRIFEVIDNNQDGEVVYFLSVLPSTLPQIGRFPRISQVLGCPCQRRTGGESRVNFLHD